MADFEINGKLNLETGDAAKQVDNIRKQVDNISSKKSKGLFSGDMAGVKQLSSSIANVAKQWLGISGAIKIASSAVREINKTISELDKSITAIATVTNMSSSDLWGQMPQYTAMAKEFGVSINDVYKTSLLYYQQGLATAQVTQLTTQTLTMAKIAGIDTAKAADYMTNAYRAFGMQMSEAGQIADTYAALAANAATSVSEISEAMTKAATSANAVGISFQNTSAFITMMIETTRESASTIGSAMASIASRYSKINTDPSGIKEEGDNMTTTLNDVDKALQSIGIDMQDANGQIRNMDEIIVELSQVWGTLDRNTQSYVGTLMAGAKQKSRFLALVSDADRLQEVMATAANSEDAAQLQLLKNMDSIETKTQQLQTAMQSLYTNLGIEKATKGFLDFKTAIVNSFAELSSGAALGKFSAMFVNISVLGIGIITKLGKTIVSTLTNAAIEAGQKAGMSFGNNFENSAKSGINNTSTNIKNIGNSSGNFSALKQHAQGIGTAFSVAGTAMQAFSMQMEAVDKKSAMVKGSIDGVGAALSSLGTGLMIGSSIGGPIGAVVGAVTMLAQLPSIIDEMTWTDQEELDARKKKAKETSDSAKVAKGEHRDLDTTITKLQKLRDARYNSDEAMKEYIEYQNQVADTYPELISGYDAEGNAVIDLASAYDKLNTSASNAAIAQKASAEANLLATQQQIKIFKKVGNTDERLGNILEAQNGGQTLGQMSLDGGDGAIRDSSGRSIYINDAAKNLFNIVEDDEKARTAFLEKIDELGVDFGDIEDENAYQDLISGLTSEQFASLASTEYDAGNGVTEFLLPYDTGGLQSFSTSDSKSSYKNDLAEAFKNLGLESVADMIEKSEGTEEELERWTAMYNTYADALNAQLDENIKAVERANIELFNLSNEDKLSKDIIGSNENVKNMLAIQASRKAQETAAQEGRDVDEADLANAANAVIAEFNEFYSNLGLKQRESFENIINNLNSYSKEDLINQMDEMGITDENIRAAMLSSWDEINSSIETGFESYLAGFAGKVSNVVSDIDIAPKFMDAARSNFKKAGDLIDKGYYTLGNNLYNAYAGIWQFASENGTASEQAALQNLLATADLTTFEGINKAIESAQALRDSGVIEEKTFDEFSSKLEKFNNTVQVNAVTFGNMIATGVATAEKALGELGSNMTMTKALEQFNSLKSLGYEGNFEDLFVLGDDGKFNYSVEGLAEARRLTLEKFNDETDKTISQLEAQQQAAEELASGVVLIADGGYDSNGNRTFKSIDMRDVYDSLGEVVLTGEEALNAMTEDELIEYAEALGVDISNMGDSSSEAIRKEIEGYNGGIEGAIKIDYSALDALGLDDTQRALVEQAYKSSESYEKFIEWLTEQDAKLAAQIANSEEIGDEFLDSQRNAAKNSAASKVDVKKMISGKQSDRKSQEDAIADYIMNNEDGIDVAEAQERAREIVGSIVSGGVRGAEQLLETMGDDLSTEQIEALFAVQGDNISKGLELITGGAGKVIDENMQRALANYGIKLEDIAENIGGQWITKNLTGDEISDAAGQLVNNINALVYSGAISLEKANSSLEQIHNLQYASANAALNLMKNVSDGTLSYSDFTPIANAIGVSVDTLIKKYSDFFTLQADGTYKLKTGNWENFINQVAEDTGLAIDEIQQQYLEEYVNYLASQSSTIDKQLSNEKAIGEGIKKQITALTSAGVGDKLNLSYLEGIRNEIGDSLESWLAEAGIIYENGIATITDKFNIGNLTSIINQISAVGGDELSGQVLALKDAVNSAIQNFTKSISTGLKGQLTNVDASNLAKQFNLNFEQAFINTPSGLQITKQAVIDIYSKLKECDQAAAEITLKNLASDIHSYDSSLSNIADVLGRIKKLEKEIASTTNSARRGQLQEELSLLKDIEGQMRNNSDAYKLSDKKLPDSLQSGLNVFQSAGNWMNTLNGLKSATKGTSASLMDYNDFCNMIQFVADNVQGAAENFMNSGMTAEQLMIRGASALKSIDGKVGVDLSNIGVNILSGSNDMGEGVTEGINNIAKSQISMLDALINMLEVVVAMEQLGDVDVDGNNTIDFGEMFHVERSYDSNGQLQEVVTFTENWKEASAAIQKMAEDDPNLQQALNSIKINGHSISELLTATVEDLDEWGISYEQYRSIFDSLYKASLSGDYDLDNLIPSVLENMNLNEAFTYEYPDGKRSLIMSPQGTQFEIIWEDEKVQAALEKSGLDKDGATKLVEDYINSNYNTAGMSDEQFELLLTLTGHPITEIKVDGQTKYEYNGHPYDSKDAALEAARKDSEKTSFRNTGAKGTIAKTETTENGDIKTEVDLTGDITYSYTKDANGNVSYEYGRHPYNSYDEMYEAILQQGTEGLKNGKTYDLSTKEGRYEAEVDLGIEPKVNYHINKNLDLTSSDIQGQIATVMSWGVDKITEVMNGGGTEEERKILFNLIPEAQIASGETATSADGQEILDLLGTSGVQNVPVGIAATVSATGDSGILELINSESGSIDRDVNVNVTGVESDGSTSTETTSGVDVVGNISSIDATSLTDASIDVTANVTSIDTTSLSDASIDVTANVTSVDTSTTSETAINASVDQTSISSQIEAAFKKEYTVSIITEVSNKIKDEALEKLIKNGAVQTTVYINTVTQGGTGEETPTNQNKTENVTQNYSQNIEISINTKTNTDTPIAAAAASGSTSLPDLTQKIKVTTENVGGNSGGNSSFGGSTRGGGGSTSGSGGGRGGKVSTPTIDTSSLNSSISSISSACSSAAGKISTAASKINSLTTSTAVSRLTSLQSAISKITDRSSAIDNLASSINKLQSKSISADVTVTVSILGTSSSAKGSVKIISDNGSSMGGNSASRKVSLTSKAKGNIALAAGRTLMGELGPELVVSNGHYYTVGNNGAEFVDLPADAIVFNHLQTQRLMNKGHAGHGAPVTNERKAVSFATGNISGDAMASASAALAALKQLRAMWANLSEASSSDLGRKSGSGSGGSGGNGGNGGGGGGGGNSKEVKAVLNDLANWYNILQRIDTITKEIEKLEKQRQNLLNAQVKDGREYVKNLKEAYELNKKNKENNEQLLDMAKNTQANRKKELEDGPYGKILKILDDMTVQYKNDVVYDLNENGNYAYNEKKNQFVKYNPNDTENLAKNGEEVKRYNRISGEENILKVASSSVLGKSWEGGVFDFLALINKTDNRGVAKYNASKQLQLLSDSGIFTTIDSKTGKERSQTLSELRTLFDYKSDGTKVEGDDEGAKDEARMQVFWDALDAWRDEMESLKDSVFEYSNAVEENAHALNEIVKELTESQQKVEKMIYDSLENKLQKSIDKLTSNMDKMKKSTDSYIKGLSDALEKERTMYDNQTTSSEVTKLQRQLAILQRTGGSASEIASLQSQLNDRLRENYFTEQQEQIDAAQKAAEKQQEMMQQQIDIQTEQLELQKSSGILWSNVNEILTSWDEQNIADLVTSYMKDAGDKSPSELISSVNENLIEIQKILELRSSDGRIDVVSGLTHCASGGLNTTTGPAWLDGTESKPEAIFNAQQTKSLLNLVDNLPKFNNGMEDFMTIFNEIGHSNGNISDENNSVSFGEVNINISSDTIGSDYDARRAGQTIMDEMVKIARKNGVLNVKRR